MVYELQCTKCGARFKYSTKEEMCKKVITEDGTLTYLWNCKKCDSPVSTGLLYVKAVRRPT